MSQTRLDYLIQVTGGDRSFVVPRADGSRPPFDELFSEASATKSTLPVRAPTADEVRNLEGNQRLATNSYADGANGRPYESATNDTAATTASNESPAGDDGHTETGSPADESQSATGASEATANQKETEEDIDDDSTLQAEAAGAQAIAVAAKAVADVTVTGDIAAEVKEAAPAVTGSQQVDTDASGKAREITAAADAISEESIVTATGEDGAEADGTTVSAAKGAKKSRRAGDVNQANTDKGSDARDPTSPREAAVVADGELNAGDGGNNVKQSIEQPGGGQEQQEANRAHQDRTESPARAETSAAANKAVAAAIANNMNANVEGGDKTRQLARSQAAKSDVLTVVTGRLHAQHATVKRAARGNGADDVPQVDPARFVGRVAKAFHTAQERGGTLQLRLSPPELGALRLELTVKDGVMTASLETENASARRVLLDHLPALRERLTEQNIRVERFDVDVRRESGGQEATPQNQHQDRQHHSESRRPPATPRNEEAVHHEPPAVQPSLSTTQINLVA